MNILETEQLNASFPTKQVLFDIDLQIRQGKKTAIVGESGSGKTVLAQGMMQLNPAVSFTGKLHYQQQDVLRNTPRQWQKMRGKEIAMVFQEPMTALNPVMQVGKQIAEVLTLHLGLDKKQAWAKSVTLLHETGIHEAEHKALAYPFQLSGGQRQRAMIAMAIAAEPKLLIADEPTTALDVAVQAQILDLLHQLQCNHQMTLLYITHDLNLVRRFADDVIVMQHGRIVEQGAVAEIFMQPQHEYTKMLLNAAPQRNVCPVATHAKTVLTVKQLAVAVKERVGWFCQREKVLLQPLSFELKQGETLGVIGESGSGKTTLAKALLHLIDATGSIWLNEQAWSSNNRRDIQMVFQDPFGAFNPRMTVLNIVAEALMVHEPQLSQAEKTARVIQTLQAVGLPDDILMRYPHEFSGGQRQRLAIARAIIVRPKVLVLDEPTSALDVQWQQQILQLLAQLQREHGLSLIMISHDLAVIRALAHRVMVLQAGKVVEAGDCERVFAAPQNDYTKTLLVNWQG